MSKNEFKDQLQAQSGGLTIEYKRVLFRAIRYWYIIVLSLLTGLTIAYLVNRYTTRIYPVTTSIIIKESQERADAKLLYDNPLANPYRNFYNEPYIMRSYPLVESVVKDLNFQVVIRKEGNFKSSEQYKSLPFTLTVLNKDIVASNFIMEVTSEQTFRCLLNTEDASDTASETENKFGTPIGCGGNTILATRTGDMTRVIGEKYAIQVNRPIVIAGSYIGRVNISYAQQGASVVNIDINGSVIQKEIDFLNKLVENYQASDLDKKNQAASRSIEFIDSQLALIGDSLAFFERQLENFKKQNVVTDLSAEAMRLFEQLEVLEQQQVALKVSGSYYTYLENYLKTASQRDKIILPSSLGIVDGILNVLVQRLIDLQNEQHVLSEKKTKNQLVSNRLAQLERDIEETKQQVIESLNNLRATDKIKGTDIQSQIDKLERRLRALPEAERKLVTIKRNYSLNESLYTFLQQRRAEAGISKASSTSDIIVVNPPRAGAAITPKITQNYIIFGTTGFILPLLVFLLLEVLNNRIQSREDVSKITSIPFIGAIGHNASETNLVVVEKPKSAMAESFRALRSNLNFFTGGKTKKVFLVASSLSGEGKSFTTINLATVFALAGKKTLIIGADLRKPKIFDDFNLSNEKGLSVYLSGLIGADEIIQQTSVENLDIISGGPVPPNPSELLLTPRMDELIASLKERYDFILMDTPPITLITDGLVLVKYADHTVFIVRQNYTPINVLRMVDELYTSGKIKDLSLVLNDVFRTGPGYGYGGYGDYGYGYAYGYGYGYGYGYFQGSKKSNGSEDYYQN
jgi:capsular exopolysaccharide synthesis family protein